MFVIQDPTETQGARLLDSLADAFQDAERIAGAFAFAVTFAIRHLLIYRQLTRRK